MAEKKYGIATVTTERSTRYVKIVRPELVLYR